MGTHLMMTVTQYSLSYPVQYLQIRTFMEMSFTELNKISSSL